jgi:hypothetical protein
MEDDFITDHTKEGFTRVPPGFRGLVKDVKVSDGL